jgi:hypothetical protein
MAILIRPKSRVNLSFSKKIARSRKGQVWTFRHRDAKPANIMVGAFGEG